MSPGMFPRLRAASDELLHVDIVRFVASAAIVFHHSHEFFYSAANRARVTDRTEGLALFVDLFFIMSGYVIAYVYAQKLGGQKDVWRFLQRRIGRLIPLHWLTLLLSILMWALLLRLGQGKHAPSFSLGCIANTAFLLNGVAPCGKFIFNGVTWSISAEMVMYALFPLVVLLARRFHHLPLALAGLLLAVLAAHSFSGSLLSTRGWTDLPPVARALPSFLLGVGVYYSGGKLSWLPRPALLLFASLLLLLVCMLTGAAGVLQLGLVYCVAICAIAADKRGTRSAMVRKLAPLGQLTFSIYMWHSLFIFLLLNAVADKFLHGATIPLIVLTAACYAGIMVWSYVSYFFIETPARRWVDGLFGGRRRIHAFPR